MKQKRNENLGQKGKGKKNFSVNKKGRVIIRNIPYKATEETLKKHFASFGTIREVNLLRRPDGNPVGCAFIQFNNEHTATQAIQGCSGKEFMGRNISVEMALEQARYIVSRPDVIPEPSHDEHAEDNEGFDDCMEENDVDTEEMVPEAGDDDLLDETLQGSDEVEIVPGPMSTKKKKRRKEKTPAVKKGRVIVRNVSFQATEENLKKHFSTFGELSEVTILRKPDGKMVGCGFIQFTDKKQAAKAIVECSGKPFLGRPIVLDWAVSKTAYTSKNKPEQEITVKEEPEDIDDIKIEDEDDDDNSVKYESDADIKSEDDSDKDETDEEDEDMDEMEEEMDTDEDTKKPVLKQKQKIMSHDVAQGKTVFVKNIPFSADNQEFKKCMEQFGEVEYALICYDRFTEHSKGTGFVKFKEQENAQTCLSAGTELTIHGQVLDCHKALERDEVHAKGKKGTEEKASKDNRNLYLIKEGVVLAGSKAAVNVSVTDMAKRLQLEQLKTQMLRNLNMFVSNNRVVIHNLPPTYDDKRLYQLFLSNSGPGAVITEAKVMRNMSNVDENGVGQSKEMGFVRFTKPEDALTALRRINNNPKIFTTSKRPIVAFAIENRMIHKIRQQREQKSRDKNPLINKHQDDKQTTDLPPKNSRSRRRALNRKKKLAADVANGTISGSQNTKDLEKKPVSIKQSGKNDKSTSPPKKKFKNKKQSEKHDTFSPTISFNNKKGVKQITEDQAKGKDIPNGEYTGVVAEPGNTRMRTKYNLKNQATLHTQVVRKDMKKKKAHKKLHIQEQIQREHIKQPKQKQGSRKSNMATREDESFTKLVDSYKSKIMGVPSAMKQKWYSAEK